MLLGRLILVVALVSSVSDALGQRGGGRGRADRRDSQRSFEGGGRGGTSRGDRGSRTRDSERGRGDFRQRMLERMDTNGNGSIDPNEMQGRAAGFIQRMAQEAGLNPNRPMSISKLTGGVNSGARNANEPSAEDPYPAVPRFGEEDVIGFGVSPETLAGKIIDLEKKYDERIVEYVKRSMERYDANKNGILEHSEWSSVRWNGDPRESDLDNDGMLTRAEMAERFAKQESTRSRDRGSSSERGRDDRSRGRGRDRGSFGRGGMDRGGFDRGSGRFGGRGGFGGGRGDFGRGGFGGRGRGGGGDEGRRGRGGRGRRGDDRGGGDDRGDTFIAMMATQMDANGDGVIQPNEVDERRRQMLTDRLQIDFSKPVTVEAITKKAAGGNDAEQGEAAFLVEGSEVSGRATYAQVGSRPLPKMLPDWWEAKDKNTDGQVTMVEFLSERSDREVNEFSNYDINNERGHGPRGRGCSGRQVANESNANSET